MRIPVLTYHAMNISGSDYASNDHVALAEDLELLARLGVAVVPLARVVDALVDPGIALPERAVALTCDDGSWFDWYDLDHPTVGPVRSFARLLREARSRHGGVLAGASMSSFVIVDPAVRAVLDRTCMIGRDWWGDDWWAAACAEGVVTIENHSLDHNHATLERTAQRHGVKGTFRNIETEEEADREIAAAQEYLFGACAPYRPRLFAYPYGECSEFLVRDYLPRRGAALGLAAAFDTTPAPLTRDGDRWRLPRYVCGPHWKSTGELAALLRDAHGG